MKNITNRQIILLCMLTFLGIKVYPMVDTVRIDGIRYELRDDGENCICTVLNSEDTIIYKNYGNKMIDYEKYSYYEGDIVIPEKVLYNGQEYSVTGVSNYAFAFCSGLRSLSLPTSLSDIGTGAFEYCVSLEDIVIPNSVSHIGIGALSGCFRLKTVRLSSSLDTIPSGLFSDCYQLKEVEIPEGVVYVGHSVFANCYMLENIIFPSTLKKIGNEAKKYFQFDCQSLANVYIRAESAPKQDYHSPFINFGDENPDVLNIGKMPCVLHVPAGSAEDYASAEGWNYFYEIVEYDPETGPDYSYMLDEEVRYKNGFYSYMDIPKNEFVVDGITYIVLSEEERTCSVVAGKIFYHDDCAIPETVTHFGIEYTVVSLSYYSFTGCYFVNSISLPETIIDISDNSLVGCYSIESLRLPAAVEKVQVTDFISLKELIIESSSIDVKMKSSVCNIDDVYLLQARIPDLVSLPNMESEKGSKIRLHVPEDALSVYESNPSFSKYWTLVGIPSDDPMLKVKSATEQSPRGELHYGIDGRLVDADAPGLHIIRLPDGRMKKALILWK